MIETETGLPGSTEQNLNLILDENLIVEGHDSNGDVLHFRDGGWNKREGGGDIVTGRK